MQEKKLNKTVLNVELPKAPEVKEAVKGAAKTVETKAENAAASAVKTVEAVGAKAKEAGKAMAEKAEPVVKKRGRKPKAAGAATAPAKTRAKKDKDKETKLEVVVQYQEKAVNIAELEAKIKEKFVAEGHRAGCIKTFNVYAKPEESKAYYVINDKFFGSVDLF